MSDLDTAISKFKAYCEGKGSFDELHLKEAAIDRVTEELQAVTTNRRVTVEGYEYIQKRIAVLNGAMDEIAKEARK